jgi:hypothetical protein
MTLGGGLLQLVAQGKQDVFLTGNPQITWFKMVYRRYTNFSVESQAIYFDGTPDFGKRLTSVIPRRGDLLGPLLLEMTLPQIKYQHTADSGKQVKLSRNTPPVNIDSTNDTAAYISNLGHAIIEEVSVEIGEQEIDKQTGEWMHIWSKLSTPPGVLNGFNDMVYNYAGGIVPPTTQPAQDNSASIGGSTYQYGAVKLYIPLQFWFNKNPGLYLPLLALQYHPIRINIKFRPLAQLIVKYSDSCNTNSCADPPPLVNNNIIDLRMYGDYVNLDTEERRRFVSNSHEYLIEQVQYTPKVSIPDKTTTTIVSLDFNHPLRELLWVIQRDCMSSWNEWFNFSAVSNNEAGNSDIAMLQQAILQLDGYDRFEVRDAGYFRLVQPYQYHTNVPTDTFIYCYSFALRPEELQPSGSLNASRIDSINLQIALRPDPPTNPPLAITDSRYVPPRGNSSIRVYATNHNILRVVNGFGGLVFKI